MDASPSPALARLADSAARILGHLGERRSFRRLTATRDDRLGSETWVPGEPVRNVRARLYFEEVRREGGVRERVERISVERRPFEPEGLSDEWQVLLDGSWTALEKVILSADGTTWEVGVCRG